MQRSGTLLTQFFVLENMAFSLNMLIMLACNRPIIFLIC